MNIRCTFHVAVSDYGTSGTDWFNFLVNAYKKQE